MGAPANGMAASSLRIHKEWGKGVVDGRKSYEFYTSSPPSRDTYTAVTLTLRIVTTAASIDLRISRR